MFLPVSAPAQQPDSHHNRRHDMQRQVEAIEQQMRQAELSGDAATIDRYLADDYMGITSNGTLQGREQTIDRIRTHQLVIKKLDLSEVKVSVHGMTAIVTSRADVESQLNGVEHGGIFRYTRVYQWRPGGWKIVNFEATRILAPNQSAPDDSNSAPAGRPSTTPAAQPQSH